MRTFIVGGYVRDRLLGLNPKDKDYVVTGVTEKEFLENSPFNEVFKKIDAHSFPVFHDSFGNEWALARSEKKVGCGYHGFDVKFGPELSIEDDLSRRDLTINSMAIEVFDDTKTRLMKVIDPHGGQDDLRNKILRHTSEAFEEDPVRVLRISRFRARMGGDWAVAQETKDLIFSMSRKGVLNELTSERIWKEMSRALMEPNPWLFFDTLHECDVLHVIFPEIYRLKTALECLRYHPEGNAYEHTRLVLNQAVKNNYDLETRFACLVHDIGKGISPRNDLPKHYGHDTKGVAVAKDFANRLRVPAKMRDRACKIVRYHMIGHKLDILNPKTFVKMFDNMGVRNDPSIVDLLMRVCECDTRGREGYENAPITHLQKIERKAKAYSSVNFANVFPNGETNTNKIQQEMYKAKLKAVKDEN